MDKPILYSDCDGVILNTIEVAYNIMQEHGCNIRNREEVDRYFREFIDWKELINKAEVINNATGKLRYIKSSNIFDDVMILTKISGGEVEEKSKIQLFNRLLPEIKVITLHVGQDKALVVPAAGNVLVDDEIGNCNSWRNQNGEAVLFMPYMSSLENDIICDLSELKYTAGVKKLTKTRNF